MRVARRVRAGAAALATLAFVLLAVGVADAHHAWNEIDTSKSLTLTGTVRSLKWENPHASLVLEITDGGAKHDWTVLMSGLARMESRGVTEGMVAAGKAVTIVASPARGEVRVVRANRVLDGGHEYVLY